MGEKLLGNCICHKKENLPEENLHLELLRTSNECIRFFVRSPRRSASRNVIALRMSDRMVRQILREDLNFPPYKIVMVQAINDQDTVNQKTVRFC